jgi:hypothetical protein
MKCLTTAFPGGICSQACNAATCPAGSTCADLRGTPAAAQVCVPSCSVDADCRPGYACSGVQNNACLPPALNVAPQTLSCAAPTISASSTVAGPATRPTSCRKPIGPSGLPSAQVQPFGTHKVGDTVTFRVPPGTGSLSILHQAVSATDQVFVKGTGIDNSAVPLRVFGPDGKVLFDDVPQEPADPSGLSVFFGGGTPVTAAMTLPNTTPLLSSTIDGGGLPSGDWKFIVNDYANECVDPAAGCSDGGVATNTYDVTVLTKPGVPQQGVLDVAFYVVGNSPSVMNAAAAAATPGVKRMIATLSGLYANAGICIRSVTFYDVPQWARDTYGTSISADNTGPCSALDQMFTLSLSSTPQPMLNFFLVQNITSSSSSGGGTIVGIDGTIPGPGTIGGTVHSGAAVSMADLGASDCGGGPVDLGTCGPDLTAYIAAHEGGHFFGLFHTTEAEGENFDPITDTLKCVCETCAPIATQKNCAGPGKTPATPAIVPASSCHASSACGGAQNLMFWQLNQSVSQGRLSPQQAQIMLLNPAVQ